MARRGAAGRIHFATAHSIHALRITHQNRRTSGIERAPLQFILDGVPCDHEAATTFLTIQRIGDFVRVPLQDEVGE